LNLHAQMKRKKKSEKNEAVSDDLVCDVCFQKEAIDVFCDSCGMAAHQLCYGVEKIPTGKWICEKCEYLKEHPGEDIKCELCYIRSGAFKPTEEGKWCHASCCVWIPETGFKTPALADVATGIPDIEKARLKLVCQLCLERGGACIQCVHARCQFSFHVTCAMKHDLRMEMPVIEGVGEDGWEIAYLHYCPKHRDVEFDETKIHS